MIDLAPKTIIVIDLEGDGSCNYVIEVVKMVTMVVAVVIIVQSSDEDCYINGKG